MTTAKEILLPLPSNNNYGTVNILSSSGGKPNGNAGLPSEAYIPR